MKVEIIAARARSAGEEVQLGKIGSGQLFPRPRLPATEIDLDDVSHTTRQNLGRRIEDQAIRVF
jgi:hypothetical protein